MSKINRVGIFCGSSMGSDGQYKTLTEEVGRELANAGLGVVYGGASIGLMGTLADAALAAGGEVYGVLPRALIRREFAHKGLTQLEMVDSLAERKNRMIALSDAFIALPGGFGTMDELFEVLTWNQLRIIQKPMALLNHHGFYHHLNEFIEKAKACGFVKEGNNGLFHIESNLKDILARWKIS